MVVVRDEFRVHKLSAVGLRRADKLAEIFSACLSAVEGECGAASREMAIVRTKLQEASFFAKRSMAVQNQELEDAGNDSKDGQGVSCEHPERGEGEKHDAGEGEVAGAIA